MKSRFDMSITLAKQILADYVNRLDAAWADYDDDVWNDQDDPNYNTWLLVGQTPEDARVQVELYVDLADLSITVMLPDYEVPLRKHLCPSRQQLIAMILTDGCEALYVVRPWERLQLWLHGKRMMRAINREDKGAVEALFREYPKIRKHK